MAEQDLVGDGILDDEPMIYDTIKGRLVGVREAVRIGKLSRDEAERIWPEMPKS